MEEEGEEMFFFSLPLLSATHSLSVPDILTLFGEREEEEEEEGEGGGKLLTSQFVWRRRKDL